MAAVTGVKRASWEMSGGKTNGLIDAFELLEVITDKLRSSGQCRDPNVLVFLDYDGTLTPIVDNPTDAVLPSRTKQTLELLSKKFPTIIVTGRSHEKVENFVKNDDILYCGSHGLRIKGKTKGLDIAQFQIGQEYLPVLKMCAKEIKAAVIDKIQGSEIEWNGLCFTVHYRRVPEEHRQLLLKLVRDILQKYNLDNVLDTINTHLKIEKQNNEQNFEEISIDGFKGLKQRTGKMVIEVLPSIDWNKGKCLSWVLDKYRQGIASGIGDQNDKTGNVAFEPIVLYIGDDVTDEDAFKTVMELKQDSSFGIVVNENTGTGLPRETNAKYILPSTIQVESFLSQLLHVC